MDEAELLTLVRPVLAGELRPDERSNDLVVVGRHSRNRSAIYFLGVAGRHAAPRWVVKLPASERRQHDLRSPLSAVDQFDTVRRLYDYLGEEGVFTTPRPIAHVPGTDAWLMEFVRGRTVADVARRKGLLRPETLMRAVEEGARALTQLHRMEPERVSEVDLTRLEQEGIRDARQHLAASGLPSRQGWFTAAVVPGTRTSGREVLLHGDWVPENVLLSPSGVHCLDPELSHRGWAEHDVARFILMLFDAPMFVMAGGALPVRSLRADATKAFLSAYYGPGREPSDLLRPLMLPLVAARWRARHEDVAQRAARLRRSRQAVLRRHFSAFLDEVSDPAWPTRH